jgi:hypothetical protein
MKTKKIVAVSILLASCAAVAADSPFEKGKTYSLILSPMMEIPWGSVENPSIPTEIKDVKDKWLLINNELICRRFNSNQCWLNTDFITAASQAK